MIEKLENVTAMTKANVYLDGKVVSHTVYLANGERKTLGFFVPGEYEFGTADAEIMDITEGVCQVLLPGEKEWREIKTGETFKIPANDKYGIRCYVPLQYICTYIKSK